MIERQAVCFYCNFMGFFDEFILEDYSCPICFSDNWEELDVDIYNDDDLIDELYNEIE